MGHSGGLNMNDITSASPPPSHASSSGGSAVPPATAVVVDELIPVDDVEPAEAVMVDPVADSTGEVFYVQLDPDSPTVTGVLPEMEQLHVQVTQLRRVLRQNGAVLYALRTRAREAGDDVCELYASPPSLPSSQTHRRASDGSRPSATARSGTSPTSQRASVCNSARAPHPTATAAIPSVLGPTPGYPRRAGDGENDEDSEWCDAATVHTSSSTTAQSTPSLHPTLLPPPGLYFFEEDEMDDDGRGSHRSSVTGVRRTFVARFRPDSMPSSVQSTPNMLPASATYARSDGGGVLSLPPSTSSVSRGDPTQQQQQQPPPSSARHLVSSPTTASLCCSVMSRLENSPPSSPAHLQDQRDAASTERLSDAEKAELARLAQRVAELYHRRGVLLQKADRILCQHAQQHERWEGNEERRSCYRCRRLFSRLTRRHHCRRCGRLCCAECSRYVGKKQDASYVAPVNAAHGRVAHRVIIKSEYAARMTADDPHVLAEESFDEHTYPRRGTAVAAMPVAEAESPTATLDEEAPQPPDNRVGRSRQHKWVRLCAPCYQNCLRARRNNVLQSLKNANLCILDDGYYYYHVLTKEELRQLSTALSKPDSFKKQVELMSHVVIERSVDYVAAAPAYGAQTLATAMQRTPDVLRTLGGISAYALRSARQTANDYVGGYFAASRTILPDNPVGAAAALSAQSAEQDAYESERHRTGEDECSEASIESLDDSCSEPSLPGTDQADVDEEAKVAACAEEAIADEEAETHGEKSA